MKGHNREGNQRRLAHLEAALRAIQRRDERLP